VNVFRRNCPTCNKVTIYTRKDSKVRADKNNSLCNSCSKMDSRNVNFQRNFSLDHREKISQSNRGKRRTKKFIENLRKIRLGTSHSTETRRKLRQITLERIRRNKGKVVPAYNLAACKVIEEYGKQHGYTFQHAENGGEFHIKELGYWVDGYDKERNVVIEYEEPRHQYPMRRARDTKRYQEIVNHLNCELIRLVETASGEYKIVREH